MNTRVHAFPARVSLYSIPVFHLQMAAASLIVVSFALVGCWATSTVIPDPAGTLLSLAVTFAAVSPVPLYWHEKGKNNLRDAALTIPWALLLTLALPLTVAVAARLGAANEVQDAHLRQLDHALGVSVPAMTVWAAHNWLGRLANQSYGLLTPLLPISFLLPAFTGKVRHAQQFLTSNLIAFAVGLLVFAFIPAVGPWYGYHLAASPAQTACQEGLLLIRRPGVYLYHPDGIVCFPSFHVVWAILCANSLWGFRYLRVPVALLCSLIILSTMTTGWHYFVDVVSGGLLALASVAGARALSR